MTSIRFARTACLEYSSLYIYLNIRAANFTEEAQTVSLIEDVHKAEVYQEVCAKLDKQWGANVSIHPIPRQGISLTRRSWDKDSDKHLSLYKQQPP